jgi:alkylhydroperoxidase/carboxymuconolactone decarboxylase family protein YurZ
MKNDKNTPTFGQLHQDLVTHVLKGKGYSSETDRQAAFNNSGLAEPVKTLIDKVANQAHKVSDGDFDAVKKTGINEDQIFELVVCAAVGQSSRQYMNALGALDEVVKEKRGGQHAS